MAKPSAFNILKTNSWNKAVQFVTQPIEKVPVGDKVLIQNTETKKVYGVRSINYEMILHEDALKTFRKALMTSDFEYELVSVELDNAGARMHAHVNINTGQKFSPRIVLTNSYDGTLSFGLDVGLSTDDLIIILETVQRWVHYGNTAEVSKMKDAINKAVKLCLDKWANKIKKLKSAELANPRQSVEFFLAQKIINRAVCESVIEVGPTNGQDLLLAFGKAISKYEATPKRKRDMYQDIVKLIFSSQKWSEAVDRRIELLDD